MSDNDANTGDKSKRLKHDYNPQTFTLIDYLAHDPLPNTLLKTAQRLPPDCDSMVVEYFGMKIPGTDSQRDFTICNFKNEFPAIFYKSTGTSNEKKVGKFTDCFFETVGILSKQSFVHPIPNPNATGSPPGQILRAQGHIIKISDILLRDTRNWQAQIFLHLLAHPTIITRNLEDDVEDVNDIEDIHDIVYLNNNFKEFVYLQASARFGGIFWDTHHGYKMWVLSNEINPLYAEHDEMSTDYDSIVEPVKCVGQKDCGGVEEESTLPESQMDDFAQRLKERDKSNVQPSFNPYFVKRLMEFNQCESNDVTYHVVDAVHPKIEQLKNSGLFLYTGDEHQLMQVFYKPETMTDEPDMMREILTLINEIKRRGGQPNDDNIISQIVKKYPESLRETAINTIKKLTMIKGGSVNKLKTNKRRTNKRRTNKRRTNKRIKYNGNRVRRAGI
jgi:hypothetical protein